MWQNLSEICASGSEDLLAKAVDLRAKSAKSAKYAISLTALTWPAGSPCIAPRHWNQGVKEHGKQGMPGHACAPPCRGMHPRKISAWRILMRVPLQWNISRDNRNGSDDIAYAHCTIGRACPLRADSSCQTCLRTMPVLC